MMKLLKELKQNNMCFRLIKNRSWLVLLLFSAFLNAQNTIDFPLVSGNNKATIIIDKNDAEVVRIATKMFVEDVFNVTGKTISINQKDTSFPHWNWLFSYWNFAFAALFSVGTV